MIPALCFLHLWLHFFRGTLRQHRMNTTGNEWAFQQTLGNTTNRSAHYHLRYRPFQVVRTVIWPNLVSFRSDYFLPQRQFNHPRIVLPRKLAPEISTWQILIHFHWHLIGINYCPTKLIWQPRWLDTFRQWKQEKMSTHVTTNWKQRCFKCLNIFA